MKYIDFSVQTLFICLTLVLLSITAVGSDWPVIILGMQIILGCWQLLSCFFLTVFKTRYHRLRITYLLITAIYFVMLPGIGMAELGQGLTLFMFIAPPWALAIFYYTITWLTAFQRQSHKGSFLPHLSF